MELKKKKNLKIDLVSYLCIYLAAYESQREKKYILRIFIN